MTMMKLKLLAYELLLDQFEYFDMTGLFDISNNANIHCNELLFFHCHFHGCVNFQSVSKTNFDRIYRPSIPKNLRRIASIHLSDHDETPKQMILFLSYRFPLLRLIRSKYLFF